MIRQFFNIFVIFLLFSGISSGQQKLSPLQIPLNANRHIPLEGWRYHPGDHQNWASPELSDSLWQYKMDIRETGTKENIVWYRRHINIIGQPDENNMPIIVIIQLAQACEIYWDGKLIGETGNIEKTPIDVGVMLKTFVIPDSSLAPGSHVLAVRVSNDFQKLYRNNRIYISFEKNFAAILERTIPVFHFKNGFELLAIILSLALFFGTKQSSYFFFGMNRLGYLVYTFYVYILYTFPVSMKFNDVIMFLVYVLDPLAYVFLGLFVLFFFDIPKKKFHLVIQFILFVTIYATIGRRFTPIIMIYSLGLSLWAVVHKRPTSILLFIGLLIVTIDFNLPFVYTLGFSTGFYPDLLFVFLALMSISLKLKHREQALYKAQLHNTRLEADLLKKNIQPHFLMNTLLTIISLIQTSPEKAIQLIRALADEFRIINKISSQQSITMGKELELCQKHLQIMGLRKSADYTLETSQLCMEDKVPPMLFHTLIENGITHAYEAFESGIFYLSSEKDNGTIRYTLKNTVNNTNTDKDFEEGMGLKYIRARLEESCPGRWELKYGQQNGFWSVVITLQSDPK